MSRSFYQLLGLTRRATSEQIREAYREMARIYHPDSNYYDEILDVPLSPEQLDKFKRITAAYNTLNNPERRTEYDQTLPPDLQDWEEHKLPCEWSNFVTAKSQAVNTPFARGMFGQVNAKKESAFEEPLVAEIKSMSEIIAARQSFWFRILGILGLARN